MVKPLLEKEIDQIVKKGGEVKEESKKEYVVITVKMPKNFLRQVDAQIEKRIGLSRNAWILESMQKNLDPK